MSNVTDERSQTQSATEQVQERVQGVAQQAKSQTREQLRSQISDRSSQAGEQMSSAAHALRRTSEQLRNDGQGGGVAKLIDAAADRGERLGSYLTRADGEQILRDAENLARKQPWLFVGGSAVIGFLASRFMRASSSGRYRAQGGSGSYPQSGNGSAGYITPTEPDYGRVGAPTGGGAGGFD